MPSYISHEVILLAVGLRSRSYRLWKIWPHKFSLKLRCGWGSEWGEKRNVNFFLKTLRAKNTSIVATVERYEDEDDDKVTFTFLLAVFLHLFLSSHSFIDSRRRHWRAMMAGAPKVVNSCYTRAICVNSRAWTSKISPKQVQGGPSGRGLHFVDKVLRVAL